MTQKDSTSFLVWQAPDSSSTVVIAHDAVERMNIEVMRGFAVSRRRGAEIGGVLLGTPPAKDSAQRISVVEFEEVPCEYSQGPSFLLSENDRRAFEDALSKQYPNGLQPVGYFRSHTREGLGLDQADATLFENYFDADATALLIKPYATRPPEAAIFRPDRSGNLDTSKAAVVFSFTSRAPQAQTDPGSGAPKRDQATAVAIPALPLAEAPIALPATKMDTSAVPSSVPIPKLPAPSHRLPARTVFGLIAFALAACSFGSLVGYQVAARPEFTGSAAKSTQSSAAMLGAGLSATLQGQGTILRWNLQSDVVKAATGGVLSIQELAGGSKQVQLSSSELKNGSVIYQGTGKDTTFTLELILGEGQRYLQSVRSSQ